MIEECKHKFVLEGVEGFYRESGRFSNIYTRMSYFFCEKCLHKEYRKEEVTVGVGAQQDLPDWAKLITVKIA